MPLESHDNENKIKTIIHNYNTDMPKKEVLNHFCTFIDNTGDITFLLICIRNKVSEKRRVKTSEKLIQILFDALNKLRADPLDILKELFEIIDLSGSKILYKHILISFPSILGIQDTSPLINEIKKRSGDIKKHIFFNEFNINEIDITFINTLSMYGNSEHKLSAIVHIFEGSQERLSFLKQIYLAMKDNLPDNAISDYAHFISILTNKFNRTNKTNAVNYVKPNFLSQLSRYVLQSHSMKSLKPFIEANIDGINIGFKNTIIRKNLDYYELNNLFNFFDYFEVDLNKPMPTNAQKTNPHKFLSLIIDNIIHESIILEDWSLFNRLKPPSFELITQSLGNTLHELQTNYNSSQKNPRKQHSRRIKFKTPEEKKQVTQQILNYLVNHILPHNPNLLMSFLKAMDSSDSFNITMELFSKISRDSSAQTLITDLDKDDFFYYFKDVISDLYKQTYPHHQLNIISPIIMILDAIICFDNISLSKIMSPSNKVITSILLEVLSLPYFSNKELIERYSAFIKNSLELTSLSQLLPIKTMPKKSDNTMPSALQPEQSTAPEGLNTPQSPVSAPSQPKSPSKRKRRARKPKSTAITEATLPITSEVTPYLGPANFPNTKQLSSSAYLNAFPTVCTASSQNTSAPALAVIPPLNNTGIEQAYMRATGPFQSASTIGAAPEKTGLQAFPVMTPFINEEITKRFNLTPPTDMAPTLDISDSDLVNAGLELPLSVTGTDTLAPCPPPHSATSADALNLFIKNTLDKATTTLFNFNLILSAPPNQTTDDLGELPPLTPRSSRDNNC